MGTILERKRGNGSTGYQAQILLKREGRIAHRETKTFDRYQAAAAWIEKREKELSKPGAIERLKIGDPALSEVIDQYTNESIARIGKTKAQVLRAIKNYSIAKKKCSEIQSTDIVAFAKQLVATVSPQTVSNYLSHLGAVFAIARPAWGYPLDQGAMRDAFVVAKRLGLTAKSRARERRPTLDELDRIMSHFGEIRRRRPSSNPMQKIVAFAIFSTRRQEEITRIRWSDLDREGSRVLVRDMKNPGQKIGNDVWCDLPPQALAIIETMPKVADEIFPFNTDAICAGFTRACQFLGLNTDDMPEEEKLKFHDLRHEGVSRLFELGWNVPHVAAVSGHRSWSSLKRYTHIRQAGDKYDGWKWLPVVTEQKSPPANP